MTNLKYGKRFGQSVVTANYTYDEELDRLSREDNARMAGIMANMPLHKQELMHHKGGQARKKIAARRSGQEKAMRDASERRMAEAVRKAVEILEFHMEEMIQYRAVGGTQRHVNQIGIHNAIVLLRTRCGVQFEGNTEYDHPVHAEMKRTEEQQRDEVRIEWEQQRLSRLRAMREMAERFITKTGRQKVDNG